MSITDVCICGAPMDAHFDKQRRKLSCEQARRRGGFKPVDWALLLRLKLQRHDARHEEALLSVRERPRGGWQARLDGTRRGFTVIGATKREVVRAVDAYYRRTA